MLIRIGHRPNPDDALMFWALNAGEVDTRGLEFELSAEPIETLNLWAREGGSRSLRSPQSPIHSFRTDTYCFRRA
jgi:1,4-dihydroxy-6-naphthoate synthase